MVKEKVDASDINTRVPSEGPKLSIRAVELLDAIPHCALILTPDFTIQHANQAARERFGLSLEEFLLSVHDRDMNIVYSNWKGFGEVEPDKRVLGAKCYRAYRGFQERCPDCEAQRVFETGETVQFQKKVIEGIWADVRAFPIRNEEGEIEYLVEWVRDITEMKEAQESLRLSEEKHRLFIENFNGIAYGTAIDDFQPYYFYGMVEEITGYESWEFTHGGKSWTDLIHPEDRSRVLAVSNGLVRREAKVADGEYRIVRKDGEIRWVRDIARCVPATTDGKQTTLPDLKVLYTSGYTDDVIAHHGVLDEDVDFIAKPYTLESLVTTIREILDR